MNTLLYETQDEARRYEVHFDNDGAAKAGSHEEDYYGVISFDKCECCDGWKEVDSLWGIAAEDEEEALECYRETMEN